MTQGTPSWFDGSPLLSAGGCHFLPLATRACTCRLCVNLMDAGDCQRIGNVNNRLKTFLDALFVPRPEHLPPDDAPGRRKDPLLCLLEDDAIIDDLSITPGRLYMPGNKTYAVVQAYVARD